ncbi:adenylate/guanylate cyclase domain-containing protein [Bradyrhizobium murdochi]|uniref:adenylate/guanylate cyclase domain-containing protein n=1 Tax=Bradyrhizobium murdochi TaxID=1038859 RepID=UPI001F42F7E2|nr:adenylate/guanylate cyclase domain-containing protein [Bradyrhizobium murdochi]
MDKFIGDAVTGDVERRRRIPITLGLHVGNIVVGNIGSADRMNYTVLGTTVNLAARPAALNKTYGTKALVSDQIILRAEAHFLFRSVDSPKGFAKNPDLRDQMHARMRVRVGRQFCNEWEGIHATFDAGNLAHSLELVEEFLRHHADHGVASYHTNDIRMRLSSAPSNSQLSPSGTPATGPLQRAKVRWLEMMFDHLMGEKLTGITILSSW